jgi:hypothetical protein
MGERAGNQYLEFPPGADGSFPHDRVARREIILGEDTTNTCNIALADVDGDGLQEIAIPLTMGEEDCVRLYRGDGAMLWENGDVRLYHAFYGDRARPPGAIGHMWYKSKHRHVLTQVADLDGDGRLEVVVGDGPIWVLDALRGAIKARFDLDGMVPLWDVVHDPGRGMNVLVACADDRRRGPRVSCLDPGGDELWSIPTPGKGFCDCMHHGDLDLDGRPEIGFSIDEVGAFWVVDCDGRVRWVKDVPGELGEDQHVDDFTIDHVLPEERAPGRQLLLVTGPNLIDAEGRVLWSGKGRFDHCQKVLAANLHPERPGKEVYTVESYRRRAYLLSCEGELLWEYDGFTRARPGYESLDPGVGRAIGRLTTAGDLIDWSGTGKTEIVQTELALASMGGAGRNRRQAIPLEALRRFVHVLDRDGHPVCIFPIEDSPMCCLAAHVTPSPGEDMVVVEHETSRIAIYSNRHAAPEARPV